MTAMHSSHVLRHARSIIPRISTRRLYIVPKASSWETSSSLPASSKEQPKKKQPKKTGSKRNSAAPSNAKAAPPPSPSVIADRATALSDQNGNQIPMVILKKDKARLFVGGSPLVYSGAIDSVIGRPPPVTGDVVMVATPTRSVIAWGTFNTTSMFRVRILQTEQDAVEFPEGVLDVKQVVRRAVAAAVGLRRSLQLPCAATTVYRLVNSEGDRLSGLTVDVLGEYAVAQSSAAWVEKHKEDIREVVLQEVPGLRDIVWRPAVERLRDEGLSEDSLQEAVEAQQEDESLLVEVMENGTPFLASPYGQKTGFYADQRDSRAVVAAAVSPGSSVLDLCCFTGGFSIAATARGAIATGVDSSEAAILLARRSAELNGAEVAGRCEFVEAEVEPFMRQAAAEGRQWDVVILDPPKLAPTRKSLERATIKYKQLNKVALKLVKPGGLFMTCSCSGAVTQTNGLPAMVAEAAVKAGRRLRLLRHAGPAVDHPVDPTYPEGAYLTNLLYFVA